MSDVAALIRHEGEFEVPGVSLPAEDDGEGEGEEVLLTDGDRDL